jgi:hypothetical protein
MANKQHIVELGEKASKGGAHDTDSQIEAIWHVVYEELSDSPAELYSNTWWIKSMISY